MQRGGSTVDHLGLGAVAPAERMRRARLRNYFNKQDFFFPIHTWPTYLQDLMLEEIHRRRDRFTLFFFLVANGLEPHIAVEWISARDYYNGELVAHPRYSEYKRNKHFNEMIAQCDDTSPNYMFKKQKKMINLSSGRVELFYSLDLFNSLLGLAFSFLALGGRIETL